MAQIESLAVVGSINQNILTYIGEQLQCYYEDKKASQFEDLCFDYCQHIHNYPQLISLFKQNYDSSTVSLVKRFHDEFWGSDKVYLELIRDPFRKPNMIPYITDGTAMLNSPDIEGVLKFPCAVSYTPCQKYEAGQIHGWDLGFDRKFWNIIAYRV